MMKSADGPLSPKASADWSGVRWAVQASNDYCTCVAVLVCYMVDAGLMALFCASGVGEWTSPIWVACTGLVFAGGGAVLVRRLGAGRLDDPTLIVVQAGPALVVMLGVALVDPPFMALMLMTVLVIITTAALRIAPRSLLVLCITAAATSLALVATHGGRLTIPADTTMQQALSGLFMLWTLAKGSSINMAGMALRMELDDSHTRLAAALARVERLAEQDELTGLPNRRCVLAALAEERERCGLSGTGFSVAMLDIDNFKRINDRYGHCLGDAVLRSVAQLMRATLRTQDFVGRVGGEEFLMILPGSAGLEEAKQVLERVRSAIEGNDWSTTMAKLHVTASIGIAVSSPGEPVESLVGRADRGLYLAKKGGRNQIATETARPL